MVLLVKSIFRIQFLIDGLEFQKLLKYMDYRKWVKM